MPQAILMQGNEAAVEGAIAAGIALVNKNWTQKS